MQPNRITEKWVKFSVMGKNFTVFYEMGLVSMDWLGDSQPKYYEMLFNTQCMVNGILCISYAYFSLICRDYFGSSFSIFKLFFEDSLCDLCGLPSFTL